MAKVRFAGLVARGLAAQIGGNAVEYERRLRRDIQAGTKPQSYALILAVSRCEELLIIQTGGQCGYRVRVQSYGRLPAHSVLRDGVTDSFDRPSRSRPWPKSICN